MTAISNAQHRVLEDAANFPESDISKFTQHLPAGGRKALVSALEKKGLIEAAQVKTRQGIETHYFITKAGAEAVGRELPAKAEKKAKEKAAAKPKADKPKRETKKGKMEAMLREGTTVAKMMKTLDWQEHSVRGSMSNLAKQLRAEKRGELSFSENDKGERIYKIA